MVKVLRILAKDASEAGERIPGRNPRSADSQRNIIRVARRTIWLWAMMALILMLVTCVPDIARFLPRPVGLP